MARVKLKVNPSWRPEPVSVEKLSDELVGRGEMPIEPGDSWFSPKCI